MASLKNVDKKACLFNQLQNLFHHHARLLPSLKAVRAFKIFDKSVLIFLRLGSISWKNIKFLKVLQEIYNLVEKREELRKAISLYENNLIEYAKSRFFVLLNFTFFCIINSEEADILICTEIDWISFVLISVHRYN